MNIYVGNLSYEVTEEELREEFTAFGEVASANIIKDKYSGQSKGFAFIEMPLLSAGQAAITGLNGKMLHNRAISRKRGSSSYRQQKPRLLLAAIEEVAEVAVGGRGGDRRRY